MKSSTGNQWPWTIGCCMRSCGNEASLFPPSRDIYLFTDYRRTSRPDGLFGSLVREIGRDRRWCRVRMDELYIGMDILQESIWFPFSVVCILYRMTAVSAPNLIEYTAYLKCVRIYITCITSSLISPRVDNWFGKAAFAQQQPRPTSILDRLRSSRLGWASYTHFDYRWCADGEE